MNKRSLLGVCTVIGMGVALTLGYSLHHERKAYAQQSATPSLVQMGTIAGAAFLSPAIGTTSFAAVPALGPVTAGCVSTDVAVPASVALAPGTYGVIAVPISTLSSTDRVITPTATLSADLTTVTISRCNTQPLAVSNTTSVKFLLQIIRAQ